MGKKEMDLKQEITKLIDKDSECNIDPEIFFVSPTGFFGKAIQAIDQSDNTGESLVRTICDILRSNKARYAFTAAVYANSQNTVFPDQVKVGPQGTDIMLDTYSCFHPDHWEGLGRRIMSRVVLTSDKIIIISPLHDDKKHTKWEIAGEIRYDNISRIFVGGPLQINTDDVEYYFRESNTSNNQREYNRNGQMIKYILNKSGYSVDDQIKITEDVDDVRKKRSDVGDNYHGEWSDRFNWGWGINDWDNLASGAQESRESHKEAVKRSPPVEIGDTVNMGVLEIQMHHSGTLRARGEVKSFTVFTRDVPSDIVEGDIIRAKIDSFSANNRSAMAIYQENIK